MKENAYQVYNRDGRLMMSCPELMRYSKKLELSLIENGFTIKLNGKKITKKEVQER
jgi:hypothetical protein